MDFRAVGDATQGSAVTELQRRTVMSREEFLQLLLTQLKVQDPTNPVSDTEFLNQVVSLANMEAVEEMRETTSQVMTNTARLLGGSLLGKTVTVDIEDGTVSGSVSGVRCDGTSVFVRVDGTEYPLQDVTEIR